MNASSFVCSHQALCRHYYVKLTKQLQKVQFCASGTIN